MIVELFANPMTWWLLATAVIFTFVGKFLTLRSTVDTIVGTTIDSLVRDGYLKTRGSGADMEIIKWRDWCDEQAN